MIGMTTEPRCTAVAGPRRGARAAWPSASSGSKPWGVLAVVGVLTAAAPVAAQQDAARTGTDEAVLTLDEAIEAALRVSPTMAQSESSVEQATLSERSAWGSFLPSLSASSGASLSSTERFNSQTNTTVTGSNDSYSAGLTASLELFGGGRRFAQLASARSETDAAQASLIERRFATVLAAKSAFFDVLRADELI
ncbi:MAG: TolC family protein, partial [Gemmatimonadota bacterium]